MFDRIHTGRWWDRGINLVEGCTPVSEGCDHCWARAMARRFGRDPDRVVFRRDRLSVLGKGRPRVWSIWHDLFHRDINFSDAADALGVIERTSDHYYIVLTKRPKVMRLYRLDMMNLCVGVTAETQARADERVPVLLDSSAALRMVSVEPILGPVDLSAYLGGLDWVICGGETGPGARPMHPDWVRSLRDQCLAAGVPFFFKTWGEWMPFTPSEDDGWWPVFPIDFPDGNIRAINIDTATRAYRVGRRRAGRELDGRTWEEVPEAWAL